MSTELRKRPEAVLRGDPDGHQRIAPGRNGPTAGTAASPDVEHDARYWHARANELERQLEATRTRLLALAAYLPPALAALVARGPDELQTRRATIRATNGT
jgi:hypothetical protein